MNNVKIKFANNKKKQWFLLYLSYLIIVVVLFKFFNLHLSTLGDYRLYSRGSFEIGFSPEVITINIYTLLSYVAITPVTLTLVFLGSLTYFYVKYVRQNLQNCFIYFSVLNPFTLQFFMYESKEALLTIFTVTLLTMRLGKILRLIFLSLMIVIRPMYFIVYAVSRLTTDGSFSYFNKKYFLFSTIILGIITVFLLETRNYTVTLINLIRQSFLPYSNASTNRDWIPAVDSLISIDFLIWYSIGLFTVFFGKLVLDSTTLFLVTVGLGKFLLLAKVTKNRLIDMYTWLLALSIYTVPLAVYNVGSALRYSIPLFVVLLFVFMMSKKNGVQNECR